MLCTKPLNSLSQAMQHIRMKPHQGRLRARGLPEDHDVWAYLSENDAECPQSLGLREEGPPTGLSYVPRMEVIRGLEAQTIIAKQRSNGVFVPPGVTTVVNVRRVFHWMANKSAFDKDELISCGVEIMGNVLLMDADDATLLGILCHGVVRPDAADVFCKDGLLLARSGGFVEQTAEKDATAMAMFGFHCVDNEFSRYKHPWEKIQKGETIVPRDQLVRSEVLELCASVLAKSLHAWMLTVFPSFVEQLEGMFEESEGLGRIGTTPYSTMGITEDYSSSPHIDNEDYGFCFISWFHTRTSFPGGKDVRAGGEFYLAEYGVYFRPRHGTALAFHSSKVCHGTRRNIGFTQLGIALLAKKEVADRGTKRNRMGKAQANRACRELARTADRVDRPAIAPNGCSDSLENS